MGDAHARNTSKMESLKSHLCGRFSYTLSSEGSDGLTWLNECLMKFFDEDIKEEGNLFVGDSIEAIFDVFLIFL